MPTFSWKSSTNYVNRVPASRHGQLVIGRSSDSQPAGRSRFGDDERRHVLAAQKVCRLGGHFCRNVSHFGRDRRIGTLRAASSRRRSSCHRSGCRRLAIGGPADDELVYADWRTPLKKARHSQGRLPSKITKRNKLRNSLTDGDRDCDGVRAPAWLLVASKKLHVYTQYYCPPHFIEGSHAVSVP